MISKICKSINNYFSRSVESVDVAISGAEITGSFGETYIAGQYIRISESYLNDGVYKLQSATSTTLTLTESINTEDTDDEMLIWGLAIPKDFLDLVTEIEAYTNKPGIASESIDDYSISFGGGGQGGWESAFMSRLNAYRKVYSDDYRLRRDYNIRTKSYD